MLHTTEIYGCTHKELTLFAIFGDVSFFVKCLFQMFQIPELDDVPLHAALPQQVYDVAKHEILQYKNAPFYKIRKQEKVQEWPIL